MIMNMVMFDRLPWFSDTDLLEDTRGTIGHLQANPDPLRKQFLKGGEEVLGLYLWPNHRDASTVRFTMALRRMSLSPPFFGFGMPGLILSYRLNFLCFNRFGSKASGPSRRFLSSS